MHRFDFHEPLAKFKCFNYNEKGLARGARDCIIMKRNHVFYENIGHVTYPLTKIVTTKSFPWGSNIDMVQR